jgi:hypothetical protein
VSFISDDTTFFFEEVVCNRKLLSDLADWIKNTWARRFTVPNYVIYVRGYNSQGAATTCPLERLVEQFGLIRTLSDQVETFLELSVNIFEYGTGISTMRGKKPLLQLKVFTCDNFEPRILLSAMQSMKNVPMDSFHIVINDRNNPSLSIRITKMSELLRAKWYGSCYAVFYLPLHSSYSELVFVQL